MLTVVHSRIGFPKASGRVKGCLMPAINRRPIRTQQRSLAGVGQASREESAECTAAVRVNDRLWGFE